MPIKQHLNFFLLNKIACSILLPVKMRIVLYRWLGVKVGSNVMLGASSFMISNKLEIGNNTLINNHVTFQNGNGDAKIVIGNYVRVAPNVLFETVTHEIGDSVQRAGKNKYASITVGDGAWIGCNVTILPGVTIAPGCIIGAGAVVVKNTNPNGVYVGVPAHRIRDLDQ